MREMFGEMRADTRGLRTQLNTPPNWAECVCLLCLCVSFLCQSEEKGLRI